MVFRALPSTLLFTVCLGTVVYDLSLEVLISGCLPDTLLEKASAGEIEAVLAHELGHWKHHHILLMLASSQLSLFVSLSLFSFFLFNPSFFASFGFPRSSGLPVVIGMQLSQALLAPVDTVASFLSNVLSRKLEFQADAFAKGLGGDYAERLKKALVRLVEENAALVDYDW
jgi:STE24 endopeptidase